MRRRVVLGPADASRVRQDPRFRLAQRSRPREAEWRTEGRCLELDPEVFFPAPAEDPAPALRVCAGCSVVGPCLAVALESGESEGVWGATTPEERRVMRQVWSRPGRREAQELTGR